MEYGAGRLESVARSACEIFKIHPAAILRSAAGASMLLDKEIVAAASLLDDAIDGLNSLLAVEYALGRLPAVEVMNAFEAVNEAVKRLPVATVSGGDAPPRPPHSPRHLHRRAHAERPIPLHEYRLPLVC